MKNSKHNNFNRKIKPLAKTFFISGLIFIGSYQVYSVSNLNNQIPKTMSYHLQLKNNSLPVQKSNKNDDEKYNILIGIGVFIAICLIILIAITIWIKYVRKNDNKDKD